MDTWAADRGVRACPLDVASWMNTTPYRFLTISGGEPFDQAEAVSAVIDAARCDRDWIVTCYTGYQRGALERGVRPGGSELISRLDLLVDGPYVAKLHAELRWRGSSNQRLHFLTSRIAARDDASAGVEVVFDAVGDFQLIGVPQLRGFRADFESRLPGGAPPISPPPGQRSFPFPIEES